MDVCIYSFAPKTLLPGRLFFEKEGLNLFIFVHEGLFGLFFNVPAFIEKINN